VDNLSFNGLIFNSLLDSLLWDVLGVSLLIDLRDILSLVFNSVVVGVSSFMGDNFLSGYFLVFNDSSFNGNLFDSINGLVLKVSLLIRNVLNSALSLDGGLLDGNLLDGLNGY